MIFAPKLALIILPMFTFTLTTNKETFATTLILLKILIITMMLFLRIPVIIILGHSFITPFN
ncbi:hypothetical protein COM69_31590 [Bacillus toyonensis]|nr:hypothetical protein COM69_31590 [Bacillus toyonensis]PRT18356.1 hypothetical protein C6353_06845 [Bacillus toyonensis]